ncbi:MULTISPECIES: polymer-forming cytoskeletal protein [unclassified Burkholderia]|uniref:bactofilin family protein n=1 Tax=unclassified Burkholderia TaxID=2613784 RepID=UPI0007584B0C|nr:MULTISPECIES: polymer-forming cytoskeletal protein [unclassified Burkholderia]KUY49049.1 cell shape determination protein CcmA [Burkholderia sp. RF2-non_BP3]KUY85908.1 cell shape determination protein CcmA [Burkholderia sp. RF4-BP95]KUY92780.1 cell shape determination protein CcmA [Burkholderia sp. RF7-non_BP4]KUY95288.1 cell shape determination protein CcmA [Burkholderia sp. RF7-non_BP1]
MKAKPNNVTVLMPGLVVEGNMILDHGLSVFALANGDIISTEGLLHIGAGGIVKGKVQGEIVRIDGLVEGDVHARDTLEINGRVLGNVFYCGTIRLGQHAALNGQLKRVPRELVIEAAPTPREAAPECLEASAVAQ